MHVHARDPASSHMRKLLRVCTVIHYCPASADILHVARAAVLYFKHGAHRLEKYGHVRALIKRVLQRKSRYAVSNTTDQVR